jgi:hypothetical protein
MRRFAACMGYQYVPAYPATLIDCDRNKAEIEMVRRNVLVSAGRALDASEFARCRHPNETPWME